MSTALVVSIISAVVALGSAVITALLGARAGKERITLQAAIDRQQAIYSRQDERLDLMNRIRDPLLWAAFDLQSRIFNIVDQQFLYVYFRHGSEEEREYVKRNTIYVFAQYLGWIEIVRRMVQFLDLGSKQHNRELVNCFIKGTDILSSDSILDSAFRIFRGDQRAIGEVMIEVQPGDELACIGYATFYSMMDVEPSFSRWFTSLSTSIDKLAIADSYYSPRLVAFQNNLVDLIKLLDPEGSRFPDWQRSKLRERNPLSKGEREVLNAIANGASYDEISELLQISHATANTYLARIREKLRARGKLEMMEIAKEKGWLGTELHSSDTDGPEVV